MAHAGSIMAQRLDYITVFELEPEAVALQIETYLMQL